MLCCVMLALELSTQFEVTTGSQVMVAIMYGTLTREFYRSEVQSGSGFVLMDVLIFLK